MDIAEGGIADRFWILRVYLATCVLRRNPDQHLAFCQASQSGL